MATNRSRPTDAPPSMLLPMLLFVVLVLLVTPPCVVAQPSAPPDDGLSGAYNANIKSSLAIVIVFFTWAFFFVATLSVYLYRCFGDNSAVSALSTAAEGGAVRREAGRGLDPAVLESFPTTEYAAVKKVRGGKVGALECAVCLSEFSDADTLRLLPKCCHVFHHDCIDAWLASHVTCPVCRSNLADPEEMAGPGDGGAPVQSDHVAIDVEGEDRGPDEGDVELTAGPTPPPARFRRCHSEGRSTEGEHDRHVLRLPEHVQRELAIAGRLRQAESVAGYADGGDGGSRRGNRGGGRSGRAGRSDRWRFFLRTFSERRMGEGEAA